MIHSVAPVTNQQGWGNVMYIPAAPWSPRHEAYAASVREAFATGSSPTDFPAEHYERDWPNRFTPGQLNDTGRRGLGLPCPALPSAHRRPPHPVRRPVRAAAWWDAGTASGSRP